MGVRPQPGTVNVLLNDKIHLHASSDRNLYELRATRRFTSLMLYRYSVCAGISLFGWGPLPRPGLGIEWAPRGGAGACPVRAESGENT
jgi:hypothetical protein